jgi:hypothetical protein
MTAETILYPHTEGGWPLCSGCFRHRSDTAHAIDPRTGTLDLLCGTCYRSLTAREPQPLPTGEAVLERVWHRLARLHQNREIGDEIAAGALRTLAPHLVPVDAWDAFESLQDALLRLQDAEDPSTVLDIATTGPDYDAETYCNHLHGCVDDAVNKLIGRP